LQSIRKTTKTAEFSYLLLSFYKLTQNRNSDDDDDDDDAVYKRCGRHGRQTTRATDAWWWN